MYLMFDWYQDFASIDIKTVPASFNPSKIWILVNPFFYTISFPTPTKSSFLKKFYLSKTSIITYEGLSLKLNIKLYFHLGYSPPALITVLYFFLPL